MNKQIEEMANIVHDADAKIICNMLKAQPEDFVGYALPRHVCIAKTLYNAGYRKSTDVAREIFEEIDNALHAMATEYHKAGHPEYYAVCEMVHHKVMRPIEKKYESEGADDV